MSWVPLAREHRENQTRSIVCFWKGEVAKKQGTEPTDEEQRENQLVKLRTYRLRLKTERTVGCVLICCATPKLARKAAEL